MSQIINVDGDSFEITNWNEFATTVLNKIGYQLQTSIKKEIDRMKLVKTGRFRMSLQHEIKGNELTITSNTPYAVYLEYGTFDYFKRFGSGNYPNPGYPTIPKKKESTQQVRDSLPKGMQPFAPFRRIIWDEHKMKTIVDKAMKR